MMSVKKAKEHCGYEAKPVRNCCGNCGAFDSDMEFPKWVKTEADRIRYENAGYSKVERNMHCADHGFATKKMAVCRLWRAKDEPPNAPLERGRDKEIQK